ncbi:MAG: lytic transglycosylase domain-containing protein [Candidatus Ferrigenium altingense]
MAAMTRLLFILLILPMALSCQASCFEQAGIRYGIAPSLLKAISAVESGSNPAARNRNRNGSEDIGHMQINSRWLGVLASYGIGRDQLFDPCINTHVGAWILAQNISRLGYGWDAIGAYNARSPEKRVAYARRVAAKVKVW